MPVKQSLLAKHFTEDVASELRRAKTNRGFSLDDITRSGVENPDSSIGVYAPDAESYEVFWGLFGPIIAEYHNIENVDSLAHPQDMTIKPGQFTGAELYRDRVISTRARVGRNLDGFALTPGMSLDERLEVERRVVDALSKLPDDLAGTYHSLADLDEETRNKLIEDHVLFKQGDRFLESAGVNRDWPAGRGIFLSNDKKFIVWVNEEDHLRIISLEQGGDLLSVYSRLVRAISEIEKNVPFAYTQQLGYLSSCPTNLGTAMRASFHMKLPALEKSGELDDFAKLLGLSVRGIHGEHSESVGGVYDISNKRRLGLSERDAIVGLHVGARRLATEEELRK